MCLEKNEKYDDNVTYSALVKKKGRIYMNYDSHNDNRKKLIWRIRDLPIEYFMRSFTIIAMIIFMVVACQGFYQLLKPKETTGTAKIIAVDKGIKSTGFIFKGTETNYSTTLKYKGKSYTANNKNSYMLAKNHIGETAKVKISKTFFWDQVINKEITVTDVDLKNK